MKYENQSLCSACGGQCCKNDPCFFMPEDFPDLSVEGLLKEFREKDYLCIFMDSVPYISMRSKNWPRVVSSAMIPEFNICMKLTDAGCPFSYDERPSGGKLLVPDVNGCWQKLDISSVLYAWSLHMQTLLQVIALL